MAAGLVVFWPGDGRANVSPVAPGLVQGAEVVSVSAEGCEQFAGPDCRLVRVVLTGAVAEEIVATLVGSIGLVAAVTLTTALATLLATHAPAAHCSSPPVPAT